MIYLKLGIIGAGPSGLACAISFKRKNKNSEVIIFDKKNKFGKKLKASGNGKCNISNINFDDVSYNNHYFDIARFNIFDFCKSLGIMLKSDSSGRIYPYNEQSSDVLDALTLECHLLGIKIVFEEVLEAKKDNLFVVKTTDNNYEFTHLVIACGSKASSKLGTNGDGYRLALAFNHHITRILPGLAPLKCEGFNELSGIRAKCNLKVMIDGELKYQENGEIQFKEDGISGICVFQAASIFARNKYDSLVLDFFPDLKVDELSNYFKNANDDLYLDSCAFGFMNKLLFKKIMDDSNISYRSIKKGDFKEFDKLSYALKNYEIHGFSPSSFDNAQVCVGGISLDEVTNKFQSKLVDNLYFCGEVLDVDGLSGGYNIHFALASGYLLGEEI